MRKQQQVWEKEHASAAALPTLASQEPGSGVVEFAKWLSEREVKPPARALDIGCGKGRNTIYLAKLGFEATGIDYIESAVELARKMAEKSGVAAMAKFQAAAMDSGWPFPDNHFDFEIDYFSSIDIETRHGRKKCRDEMMRTLKPGGHALVMVVSTDDEIEKEIMEKSPGPERNSVIWPQNGKFQKNYDEAELREFYSAFKIIELKEVRKRAIKLGREYTATNFWMVIEKKK